MHLSQRQINTALMTMMTVGALAEFLIFTLKEGLSQRAIGYAVGALMTITALLSYRSGWDRGRYLVVIAAPLIVGSFLDQQHIVDAIALEVLMPPVVALILAEPIWVAGAGALMLGLIALRSGGASVYLIPDNLVIYALIIGGMVLSRLAFDTSQRLAEASAQADQARREAEERARELARRNSQLQQTLAENATQRAVIRELSVPILPLTEHALILPLVGTLDAARLEHARERLLDSIYTSRARLLVIDLTGVSVVDTDVIRGIVSLIGAVRLLGAEVALAGIRSEIAQTIVGLDLDLSDVAIFRDVRSFIQAGSLAEQA